MIGIACSIYGTLKVADYFLALPTSQKIIPTTTTTKSTPTQTPALKISAMAWQLASVTERKTSKDKSDLFIFIFMYLAG